MTKIEIDGEVRPIGAYAKYILKDDGTPMTSFGGADATIEEDTLIIK